MTIQQIELAGLDRARAIHALIDAEAAVEGLRSRAGRSIDARLIDELRLGGAYARLHAVTLGA